MEFLMFCFLGGVIKFCFSIIVRKLVPHLSFYYNGNIFNSIDYIGKIILGRIFDRE